MLLGLIHKSQSIRSSTVTYSYLRTIIISRRNNSTLSKKHPRSLSISERIKHVNENVLKLFEQYEHKILYSSAFEEQRYALGYLRKRRPNLTNFLEQEKQKELYSNQNDEPLPYCLKYVVKDGECRKEPANTESDRSENLVSTHFPLSDTSQVSGEFQLGNRNARSDRADEIDGDVNSRHISYEHDDIEKEIRFRHQEYKEEDTYKWMEDYENFGDSIVEADWKQNYGTADPKATISNVPCGGCGALLHCKDTSIPGYIPSEIFKNHSKMGGVPLSSIICQRCHFLKYYNIALQARVSPEDYPKILQSMSGKKALIVLVVDLLDFPCSLWPGIADIFADKPLVVVGNKVDLLLQDSEKFLNTIKKALHESLLRDGFGSCDIKHIELISAKTGFGIENLITKLHSLYSLKGDVYIVGCTNVGKSTLFNILLQSDFCKVQAADLIQRATTSPWPGTTLNLLKFPILKPSGIRNLMRHKRLQLQKKRMDAEKELRKIQLRKTGNLEYATLIGNIDRTFNLSEEHMQAHLNLRHTGKLGVNENHKDYKFSRWCYDTPGVVQPDQIVHLLTTEELLLTLPKKIIRPKVFCIKPHTTVFLAGLARLDYTEGNRSIRVVVFCSDSVPITVCRSVDADEIYEKFLGTDIFRIPTGQPERLQKWPKLEPSRDLIVTGIEWGYACADIVLSNAGWISVAGGAKASYTLKGWTPEGRGVHVRTPLLPHVVKLRGKRIEKSIAYQPCSVYIPQ